MYQNTKSKGIEPGLSRAAFIHCWVYSAQKIHRKVHYYYFIRRQPAFFSDSTKFLNSHGLQGRKFGLRSSRRHSSPRSPPGLKENASSYLHNTKTPPASHTSPFCTRSKAPLLSCSHTHTQASKQTYIHIQPFINNTYTHLSLLLITKGRVGGFLRP